MEEGGKNRKAERKETKSVGGKKGRRRERRKGKTREREAQ